MGLYAIDCPGCKKPFMWFSGQPHQFCEKCVTTAKEDASTNSLGAMPTGRLITPGTVPKKPNIKKLINPLLKGESMSLAKKYLDLLFEDENKHDDDAPPADMPPADEPAEDMMSICMELEAAVAELKDAEKEKLMPLVDKLKGMCVPPQEEPAPMEEPAPEAPADEEPHKHHKHHKEEPTEEVPAE